MAAPSAGNQQPWEFYVVRDAGKRAALVDTSPYAKPAGRAPVVVVVCAGEASRFKDYAVQDLSAAVENMLLQVVEEGLGAVWMGVAPLEDRMKAVGEIIGAPEGVDPFALVSIGYPEGEVVAKGPERYDASRVHWL